MKKKRAISFIIMMATLMNCVAQIPNNIDDLRLYYQQNILTLKPLEGIYSWSQKWVDPLLNTVKNSSGLKAFYFSKQHDIYIYLHIDSNGEITYRLDRGVNYIYNESTHVLCLDDGRRPWRIDDLNYFVTHEKWNSGDTFDRVYSKIYPTPDMYADAALEKDILGAANLIDNGYYSSAIAILDGVLKTKQSPREYYYRASAYYCLKEFHAAIQDCNRALNYDLSSENASAIYYLRGLCHFLINDKESGISDMKNAGEDGIKFLDENGFNETTSKPQRNNNKITKTTTTQRRNNAPALKKTK